MRRFFVLNKAVWQEQIDHGGRQFAPRFCLFKNNESHYIDLTDDGMVLLAGELANEASAEVWHAHPEIASLPHPTLEGNVTFDDVIHDAKHAHRQFKDAHLAALNSHPALKIDRQHTIWELHEQARKIHPLVRLTNIY
jgi:hypothetical protein